MKNSQKELSKAIQLVADSIGHGAAYTALAKEYNIPSITKALIYDMYVEQFNPHNFGYEVILAEQLIRKYVKELSKTGFVEFDKKETSPSLEALKGVAGLLKDDITDEQMNEMLNDK